MAGLLLRQLANVDVVQVSYKGNAPAVTDLIGGHVTMMFVALPSAKPYLAPPRVRGLAVTTLKRSSKAPDVPTMAESGFPKLTLRYWMGLWAPPHTPKAIVQTLNASVLAGLKTPELLGGLNRAGFQPLPVGADAIAGFVQSESPTWLEVARTSGVKGD